MDGCCVKCALGLCCVEEVLFFFWQRALRFRCVRLPCLTHPGFRRHTDTEVPLLLGDIIINTTRHADRITIAATHPAASPYDIQLPNHCTVSGVGCVSASRLVLTVVYAEENERQTRILLVDFFPFRR